MTDKYYFYKCGENIKNGEIDCIRSSEGYKDFEIPSDYTNITLLRLPSKLSIKHYPSIFSCWTLEDEILSKELKKGVLINIITK